MESIASQKLFKSLIVIEKGTILGPDHIGMYAVSILILIA